MRLGELQTAYAQQLTHKGVKGEWVVYNEDQKEIYKLPADWSEKQVMVAIKLGREFEMKAFNRGVQFQKDKQPKQLTLYQQENIKLRNDKKTIINRNEVLAKEIDNLNKQLDRLTIKN